MNQFRRLVREAHRRSLWQVLGIYAVVSWIVYQVVLALYEGIGLPDWVPGTALVLLLLGLPIVLATAFVQEPGPAGSRGSDASGGDGPARSAPPRSAALPETRAPAAPRGDRGHALFTWPRAITAGVLAFAALGLAASGFMGMRALGIGPAATLVSAGVLEAREPVLLAQLGSASGDSVLASAVTEALRVDLESSPVVRLVQGTQVQDALRRMRRDPAAPLTEALATELAVREGIRAILTGDVTTAGGQVVLTARLIGPDGAALASVRETATPADVIEAADRLSAALRERLGESLRSIRKAEPLAQVTTASLDALRAYSQAVRAYDAEPDPRKSIVLLQEAIAADSAFAMAWRKLGVAYQNVSADSMRLALEQAHRHRERLNERERYLTDGTYYDIVASDTARAMLAYETLLDAYPDEPTALHNLARLHSIRGELEEAAELYGRKLALDSSAAVTLRNQIHILARLKRYDEAESLLDVYDARHPDHFQVSQFRGALAALRFDYDAAIPFFRRAQEMNDVGGFALRSILLIRGRYAEMARALREDMQDSPTEAIEAELAFADAVTLAFHRFEPAAALARFERFATEQRIAALPPAERPYFERGILHVLAGDVAGGERVLERWRTERPEDFEPLDGQARDLTLEIAAARGQPQELLRLTRRQAADGCLECWFHLGRVYEAAGMADSAVVAYETYLDPPHPPLFRVNTDRWSLPGALQRLAALHEEAGRAEEAARYYARFVELWENADPELQTIVDRARQALARLTGESGQKY